MWIRKKEQPVQNPNCPIWHTLDLDLDIDIEPFILEYGWTEIWEHGKYLGILDGFLRLERYIQARPGRKFQVRFIHRPRDGQCGLFPFGWIGVHAGKMVPRYYAIERRNHEPGT